MITNAATIIKILRCKDALLHRGHNHMTLMITAAIISKRVPSTIKKMVTPTIKKKVTSPQKPSCCDSSPVGAVPRPSGRPRPSPGIFIILRSIVI